MNRLTPIFTLLFVQLWCYQIAAQDIYYVHINASFTGFAISRINPNTCEVVKVVDIQLPTDANSQTFSDITFAPNGSLYVTESKNSPSSKGISVVDTLTGVATRVVDLPFNDVYNSLTCSSDYTFYFGANSLYSYNLLTNTLTAHGGPFPFTLAGDLTFQNGALLGTANGNLLVEMNTDTPTQSTVLFNYTTDFNYFAFGVVSYSLGCDSTIMYITANENGGGSNPNGKLYQLDFNSQSTTFLCDMPQGARGAAMFSEHTASYCDLELNLDADTSSAALPTDFQAKAVCDDYIVFLADTTDAFLRSGYRIDSMVVRLLPSPAGGGFEVLVFYILSGNNSYPDLLITGTFTQEVRIYNKTSNLNATAALAFEKVLDSLIWVGTPGILPGPRTLEWIVYASGGRTDTAYTYFEVLPPNVAGADKSVSLCANAAAQDLSTFLSADAQPGGIWWPLTASGGSVYNPVADAPGVFAYVVSAAPDCPSDTARITVSENPLPVFSVGVDRLLCAGSSLSLVPPPAAGIVYTWNNGVAADSLVVSTPGLYWALATDANGCSWSDTVLVSAGDTAVVYTSMSTCVGQSANWNGFTFYADTALCVTYTALNGCDSTHCFSASFYYPVVSLDTTLCQGQTLTYIGETFTEAGTYEDTLSLFGCMTRVEVELNLTPPYTLQQVASLCSGQTYLWYGDTLEQPGQYQRLVQQPGLCDTVLQLVLTPAISVTLDLAQSLCAGDTLQFGTQVLTQSGIYYDTRAGLGGACDTVVTLVLSVQPLPVPTLGGDTLLCAGDQATLGVSDAYAAYIWSNGSTNAQLNGLVPDTYYVTVTDASGCTGSDGVVVSASAPIVVKLLATAPLCPGSSDGAVSLAAEGGTGPYQYALQGGTPQSDSLFALLPAGNYTVQVIDQLGCTDTDTLSLTGPAPWSIDVGAGLILAPDDAYAIPLTINGQPLLPLQYAWYPPEGLSCADCAQPVATLQQTTTYQVTVSDANGCTQTDTLELRIRDSIAVYIPNVFTPNGDALNEVFTVFARPGTQVIVDVFRVFNRWGELVYEGKNMTPGDYAQGWDGQVRGKDAPADVYVWYAELRLPDGAVEQRQGDVTLLR